MTEWWNWIDSTEVSEMEPIATFAICMKCCVSVYLLLLASSDARVCMVTSMSPNKHLVLVWNWFHAVVITLWWNRSKNWLRICDLCGERISIGIIVPHHWCYVCNEEAVIQMSNQHVEEKLNWWRECWLSSEKMRVLCTSEIKTVAKVHCAFEVQYFARHHSRRQHTKFHFVWLDTKAYRTP